MTPPVLRTIVPCQRITSSGDRPPYSLHDVTFTIRLDQSPENIRLTFALFFAYTESIFPGHFHLRVYDGIGGRCSFMSPDIPAGIHEDATTVFGQPIEFEDIAFPSPGQYSIHVYWQSQDLGCTYLEVKVSGD